MNEAAKQVVRVFVDEGTLPLLELDRAFVLSPRPVLGEQAWHGLGVHGELDVRARGAVRDAAGAREVIDPIRREHAPERGLAGGHDLRVLGIEEEGSL